MGPLVLGHYTISHFHSFCPFPLLLASPSNCRKLQEKIPAISQRKPNFPSVSYFDFFFCPNQRFSHTMTAIVVFSKQFSFNLASAPIGEFATPVQSHKLGIGEDQRTSLHSTQVPQSGFQNHHSLTSITQNLAEVCHVLPDFPEAGSSENRTSCPILSPVFPTQVGPNPGRAKPTWMPMPTKIIKFLHGMQGKMSKSSQALASSLSKLNKLRPKLKTTKSVASSQNFGQTSIFRSKSQVNLASQVKVVQLLPP